MPERPSLPPSLREIQARLFALITAPESVARTLEARGEDARSVAELVVGDAVRRLDIYANMYFFRLRDVLAADYPAVAAALGSDEFHNLCTAYLAAFPSQHPSLRWIGAALPAFVAGREPAWLGDLARLEWARLDVFDAPDQPVLSLDALRALDGDALAALPLAAVVASRRLGVQFAVDDVWRAASDGAEIVAPAAGPRALLVWRQGVQVFHRVIDGDGADDEMEALACLDRRPTFGALCEQLGERRSIAAAAQRAFELLGGWAASGLLVAC